MMQWFKNHHIWTKILAVVIAIGLWAIVIASENPEKSMDISTDVELIGESTIRAGSNLIVTSISDPDVTIRVKSTFSRLGEISAEDIVVRADVSKFTVPGRFALNYDVSLPYNVTRVGQSPETIYVTLERIVEKQLAVRVEYDGELEEGLEIIEAIAEPTVVTVFGVESVMENAKYAVIKLNASDLRTDFSGDRKYYIADADGKRLDSEYTSSLTETVHIDVPVYMTKEVPLTVERVGNEYIDESKIIVDLFPASVSVYGKAELLRELEEINVGTVDVSEFGISTMKTFDIILPEGVEFSGNSVASVEADISLDGITTTQVSITEFVQINIPPEELNVLIETINIVLSVRGEKDDIKLLKPEDFTVTVDVSARSNETGRQQVPVVVECKNPDIEILNPGNYTIIINVTEKE